MTIYFLFLIFCVYLMLMNHMVNKFIQTGTNKVKILYTLALSIPLFLIMALRHSSVGIDTQQYLFRYENFPVNLTLGSFKGDETLFYFVSTVFSKLGVSFQWYLAILSGIIVYAFMRLYQRYSYNIGMTLFLHMTIGSFEITMSAIRQSIAICIVLFAFDAVVNGKLKKFILLVLLASLVHTSALFFMPVYLFRKVKITQKMGVVMLVLALVGVVTRSYLGMLISFVIPARYVKYGAFNDSNPMNMLLILIAFLIPSACLFFWKTIEKKEKKEFDIFSLLIMMSFANVFINVLALNSSMISRMGFYFIPFNIILITNVIATIKSKYIRVTAYIFALMLPFAQFIIATPGGTLAIDKYMFFWQ